MNIQPKISLCAPAIHQEFWEEFLDSLKNNEIPYEVIFVGNVKPEFDTSKYPEFRHIFSTVKPSQCTHIAFMEANGELISLTADDVTYFSPNKKGALDNMYNFIMNFPEGTSYNKLKIAYGFRMFEDQFCNESSYRHYVVPKTSPNPFSSPLIYPFFVMYKRFYQEMGGYDNRFVCGQAETDLLLRIATKWGHTESSLCSTSMVWGLHNKHNNMGSFRKYHAYECDLIRKLWLIKHFVDMDYLFAPARKDSEVRSYKNKDLLTVSQGDTGEWK